MQNKEFYISSLLAERFTMTCLIIATKYYCETQDLIVNIDICKLMDVKGDSADDASSQCYLEGAKKLIKMELRVLDLIDFDLYVSPEEYNQTQ